MVQVRKFSTSFGQMNAQVGMPAYGPVPGQIYFITDIVNGLVKLTPSGMPDSASYFEYPDRVYIFEDSAESTYHFPNTPDSTQPGSPSDKLLEKKRGYTVWSSTDDDEIDGVIVDPSTNNIVTAALTDTGNDQSNTQTDRISYVHSPAGQLLYSNRISSGSGFFAGYTDVVLTGDHYVCAGNFDIYALVEKLNKNLFVEWTGKYTYGVLNPIIEKLYALPDNSFLGAGNYTKSGKINPALMKFTPSGLPDNTFGVSGIVTLTKPDVGFWDVATQSTGKIVTAGGSPPLIMRFTASGTTDNTFGVSGIYNPNSVTNDIIYSIVVQSDDKIVFGLDSVANSTLGRVTSSGTKDNTFNGSGLNNVGNGTLISTIVPYNTSLVLSGTDSHSYGAAWQCSASGTNLVQTISLPIDLNAFSELSDIYVQSDGKIVFAGYTSPDNNTYKNLIVRCNNDFTLDTTFGDPA